MNSRFSAAVLALLSTFLAFAAPANDAFEDAEEITALTSRISASNRGATADAGEPVGLVRGYATVWWRWTAPHHSSLHVKTETSMDTVLTIFRLRPEGDYVVEAFSDDTEAGFNSEVFLDVTAGTAYFICVDGYEGEQGVFTLAFDSPPPGPPPPNDLFAAATELVGIPASATASNRDATTEPDEVSRAPLTAQRSVWWKWTAPASQRVSVTTKGSSFDTALGVYQGSSLASLQLVARNDDDPATGDIFSALSFEAVAGRSYMISVGSVGGRSGDIVLRVEPHQLPKAPAWSAVAPDGSTISSTDFAGKVVVLNFWATWCGPCVDEIPDLIQLHEERAAEGLVVVGPSTDSQGMSVVRPFVAEHGINYPVVLSSFAMRTAFGSINAIPTTFIINRNNEIVHRIVGRQTKAQFEELVLPLLAPAPVDPPPVSAALSTDLSALTLRWAAVEGFALQESSDLRAPQWRACAATVQTVDGNFTATVSVSAGSMYYRLARQ